MKEIPRSEVLGNKEIKDSYVIKTDELRAKVLRAWSQRLEEIAKEAESGKGAAITDEAVASGELSKVRGFSPNLSVPVDQNVELHLQVYPQEIDKFYNNPKIFNRIIGRVSFGPVGDFEYFREAKGEVKGDEVHFSVLIEGETIGGRTFAPDEISKNVGHFN